MQRQGCTPHCFLYLSAAAIALTISLGQLEPVSCSQNENVWERLRAAEDDLAVLKQQHESASRAWVELQTEAAALNAEIAKLQSEGVNKKTMTNLTMLAGTVNLLSSSTRQLQESLTAKNGTLTRIFRSANDNFEMLANLNASVNVLRQDADSATTLPTLQFSQDIIALYGRQCFGSQSIVAVDTLGPLCQMIYKECWPAGRMPCSASAWSSAVEDFDVSRPYGVHASPDGTVFVASLTSGDSVRRATFSASSNLALETLVTQGGAIDVATEADGSVLFVTDNDDSLYRISNSGDLPRSATKLKSFNNPYGVAVAPNKHIIIAAELAHKVYSCPPDITTSGTCTTIASGLNKPTGVDVDENGNVFVADTNNNRILRIPIQNGNFGSYEVLATGLSKVKDVAVTVNGHVVCAQDDGSIKLCLIDPSSPSSCAGIESLASLGGVWGVSVAPNSDILVGDKNNNKVYRLRFKGNVA